MKKNSSGKKKPSTKKNALEKTPFVLKKNSFDIKTNHTPLKKKKQTSSFFFRKKILKKMKFSLKKNFSNKTKTFEKNKAPKKNLKHQNIKTFKIQTNPLEKKNHRMKQKRKNLWKKPEKKSETEKKTL